MEGVPGWLETAGRLGRQYAATVGVAACVQLLLIGLVLGLGPLPVSTLALLAYCSLEVATFLVELAWVWNPGSYTAESYAAMMGLARLAIGFLVLYGLLATLLLRNNVVGCFLLFVLCTAAREMGHQMLHYSKEVDLKARAAGSFLCAFTVALGLGGLVAYAYLLTSWALVQSRPLADEVLFSLLGPFVRLFALLSAQRYLGRQLLEKGLLDALTLYLDLSISAHLAVDVPFFLALLVFSGPTAFAISLAVTGLTDVAYAHALGVLVQREEGAVSVTFAQQRPGSVFAALVGGAFAGRGESSALLSGQARGAVSSAVTASIGDKDNVRPIGTRVSALLDEYQELTRALKSPARVWSVQEFKAAVEAHSLGEWVAIVGATLALLLLPGLRVAAGLTWQAVLLRVLCVLLVTAVAELLRVRELQAQVSPAAGLGAAPSTTLALGYRAAAAAVPACAILAAM